MSTPSFLLVPSTSLFVHPLLQFAQLKRLTVTKSLQVLKPGGFPGLRYIADGTSPLKNAPAVEQSFVAHSPEESKYMDYLKPPNHLPFELWMPLWELHEMEALRARCFEGKVTREEVR